MNYHVTTYFDDILFSSSFTEVSKCDQTNFDVRVQPPDFFKDVSFHVSFHVKFGYMRFCDFSINNPQNTCLVT